MEQKTSMYILFYFLGAVTSYLSFRFIDKKSTENSNSEHLLYLSQRLKEEEEINKKNSEQINNILNSINIINTAIKEDKEKEVVETPKEAKAVPESQLVLKEWLLGGDE